MEGHVNREGLCKINPALVNAFLECVSADVDLLRTPSVIDGWAPADHCIHTPENISNTFIQLTFSVLADFRLSLPYLI